LPRSFTFQKGAESNSPWINSEYLKQFPRYREAAMNLAAIQSAAQITDIPELHDRLIAGTARRLGLALITNDPAIQASSFVKTIW